MSSAPRRRPQGGKPAGRPSPRAPASSRAGRADAARRARRAGAPGAAKRPGGETALPDHHHRNLTGGWARAAVFGVSDGLVTNVSLILGMAGAHPAQGVVRLAGLAGLVGGAFSMAAGEYVSMRAQRELLERELALERHEIRHRPEGERRELVHIYEARGLAPDLARKLADAMMSDPEKALETHAREELGIDPGSLGRPFQAATSSFVTFAVGALVPLVPWLFTGGEAATVASVSAGGASALVIGFALSFFTDRPRVWSAIRQLAIAVLAAAVTWSIGHAIGAGAA
ncbi:MAG: VIT1/CCC1 transporter family protein [Actinobacteria bacterium]|nr:VIT1/CCC1 transporter family protein [Actinomycetota bacterium]MDA8184729.1 VIT1/CCC1 transporter family protein [Actinomycetota bacterium]